MNAHTDPSSLHDALDPSLRFPADFCWGVATSSFQIEGAAQEGGKGESIWDRFCRLPGAIADGSNGDVACDHVHRLEEDLNLIASLGVNTYRFSVSWPRVQPLGQGAWSEQGLDFYSRLIEGLARRGLKAHMTLNHWDLPQSLQDAGGWASKQTVEHFVDYARGMARRFGNQVEAIATHNEPWVVAFLGHETGIFAPGLKDRALAIQVSHHLLLSHGLALRALRADGCKARLGIVLNLAPMVPAEDSPQDVAKAHLEDGRLLRWFMDPMFRGAYPQDVLDHLGPDAPQVEEGDMCAIAVPLDYLGINYYSRSVVSAGGPFDVNSSGLPLTDMGWEIYPQGLTDLLLRLHQDYPVPPLYITENGGAFPDRLADGRVHDADRIRYLADHIAAMGEALRQGVPMAGYMVWSLMDNFEWASGYEKRFGIVHVDYQSLKRTLKDSAHWYQRFLQSQRRPGADLTSAQGTVQVGR
ncbi:MAG: GH1 family beta-glucosidase [Betaproteobacteria bacterium]